MKIVKTLVVVVTVAVAVFFVWNYLAGPLKYRRDMQSFADNVASCEPGTTAIKSIRGGLVLDHTVEGRRGERCHVRIEAIGNHVVQCAFPTDQLDILAKGFENMAQEVGIFGGTNLRVSTSNPDPLTEALNSDACETIAQ